MQVSISRAGRTPIPCEGNHADCIKYRDGYCNCYTEYRFEDRNGKRMEYNPPCLDKYTTGTIRRFSYV